MSQRTSDSDSTDDAAAPPSEPSVCSFSLSPPLLLLPLPALLSASTLVSGLSYLMSQLSLPLSVLRMM